MKCILMKCCTWFDNSPYIEKRRLPGVFLWFQFFLCLEYLRQERGRDVLVADRTEEAFDGGAADRGTAAVAGCRIRAAVDDGVADFYPGAVAVKEDAAGFALQ